MLAIHPLQVIPGRRHAANPEPKNTEPDDEAVTAERGFPEPVFMGSRLRGNDLGGG